MLKKMLKKIRKYIKNRKKKMRGDSPRQDYPVYQDSNLVTNYEDSVFPTYNPHKKTMDELDRERDELKKTDTGTGSWGKSTDHSDSDSDSYSHSSYSSDSGLYSD